MKELRKLSLLVLLSLALTSCEALTSIGVTDPEGARPTAVCQVWLPVTWSTRDTEQTIREARANNRAREAWGCAS